MKAAQGPPCFHVGEIGPCSGMGRRFEGAPGSIWSGFSQEIGQSLKSTDELKRDPIGYCETEYVIALTDKIIS